MQILQILVRHFEYLMSCDFLKNYTATTNTKNKIFSNFDKNPIIFTSDFVVRVRYLIFPGMTSSIKMTSRFYEAHN